MPSAYRGCFHTPSTAPGMARRVSAQDGACSQVSRLSIFPSQQVSPVAFGILRLGECKEAQEFWTLSHFYLQSTVENLFCFAFLLPGELREHFAKFGHIKRCSVPFVSIKIITKTIAGWDGGISVVEHCLVCMRLWVWSQTSRWKNYHLILVFFLSAYKIHYLMEWNSLKICW